MAAVEVDIAEAIKDELNSRDFGIAFQAERSEADPTVPLETLGQLRIDVVPWLPEPFLDSRGKIRYEVPVDILIRKKFDGSKQDLSTGRVPIEETDKLRKLRQDITELFMPSQPTNTGRALTTLQAAVCPADGVRVMAGMIRPHMKQHRQFTGWVRVTHFIHKAAETAPLKT